MPSGSPSGTLVSSDGFSGLIDTRKFVNQRFSSYHQGEGPAPFRVLVVRLIDLGFAFQNKLIK